MPGPGRSFSLPFRAEQCKSLSPRGSNEISSGIDGPTSVDSRQRQWPISPTLHSPVGQNPVPRGLLEAGAKIAC